MMGMDLMMKSLGLDPEQITKTFDEIGALVREQVILARDNKAALERVEKKLDALLERDPAALIALTDAGQQEIVENAR